MQEKMTAKWKGNRHINKREKIMRKRKMENRKTIREK